MLLQNKMISKMRHRYDSKVGTYRENVKVSMINKLKAIHGKYVQCAGTIG